MSQIALAETSASCRDMFFLVRDWEDWRESLKETISAAREVDPSEPHVIAVVEDMIDFLTNRVHSGSPEEARVASLWDHATPEERRMLARCFMEDIESRPISGP
ncbi:MAG: DUF3243 family protein [Methanomassiliicoccus sp.]|nr:DUF3243 family protein [Methanomassiliicoccus sp.]